MTVHQSCLTRQARLLDLIPFSSTADYPGTRVFLEKMADAYMGSGSARRRLVERDLDELLQTGQIEVVNPGGKPRYFRRRVNDAADDPRLHGYIEVLSVSLLKESLPSRRHQLVLDKLRDSQQRPLLGESRFRFIGDSLRLLPAEIKAEVLIAVLAALIQRQVLRVGYRKADGSLHRLVLHPQGLLQRGPILYLYALKNNETSSKMFALHRMTSASVQNEAALDDPNFDLDRCIQDGEADFGRGEMIELQLRVRGYILDVLRDCPLSEDQCIVESEDGDAFAAVLTATLPSTGQLHRWLLGCGRNIEVLAPEDLRRVVSGTVAAMAAIYR